MADSFDFKKEYKDLYLPKAEPMILDVPAMKFIMVDGRGDPNTAKEYQGTVEILYGLSYAIKMSKRGGNAPNGYFDYVVAPLEGFWWFEGDVFDGTQKLVKDDFFWTALIRQPDFVTLEVFDWALSELKRKKPAYAAAKARLESLTEGFCVQMMHLGPFDTEPETVAQMEQFIAANGYVNAIGERTASGRVRWHHEIYLSDPRKVAQEKMKTVVRHPIRRNPL